MCLFCPHELPYEPLCGDNGQTYANECWRKRDVCLHQKQINLVKNNACGIEEKIDLTFLIDISKYVTKSIGKSIKAFLKAAIQSYSLSANTTRTSIFTFSEDIDLLLSINKGNTKQTFHEAISLMGSSNGDRKLYKALKYLNDEVFLNRANSKQVVVLLTTGLDDTNMYDPLQITRSLNAKGIKIVILLISNEELSADWIDANKQNLLYADNLNGLPGVLGELEKQVGMEYGKLNNLVELIFLSFSNAMLLLMHKEFFISFL